MCVMKKTKTPSRACVDQTVDTRIIALNIFERLCRRLPYCDAACCCRVVVLVVRRSSEFVSNGIKVVCSSRHTPRLQKLQKLSLYDNMLSGVKVSPHSHNRIYWYNRLWHGHSRICRAFFPPPASCDLLVYRKWAPHRMSMFSPRISPHFSFVPNCCRYACTPAKSTQPMMRTFGWPKCQNIQAHRHELRRPSPVLPASSMYVCSLV